MRRTQVLAVLLAWAFVAVASGQVSNGGFEAGVTGNCPDGWTCDGNVSVFEHGDGHMLRLDEPASGAVSRAYQVFPAPTPVGGTVRLSFRYALVSLRQPGAVPATVPPDGFTAFLVDPFNGTRQTLLTDDPPTTNPEFWGRGYYYQDSDGVHEFASYAVNALDPDPDRLVTVVFEVTDLEPNEPLRVEFGLAGAANGTNTFVVIDDVTTDCPPDYCCDAFGNVLPKYDDDDCTEDICVFDPNTGVLTGVDHPEIECCIGCVEPFGDVDIMFMLDYSGSMEVQAREQANMAVEAVLALYEPYATRPAIGVGRFATNWPAGAIVDHSPTTDYDDLRAALPNVLNGGGNTSLAAAITVAAGEMPDTTHRRYVMLLTDGFANYPPGSDACNDPSEPDDLVDCNDPANDPSTNGQCACARARSGPGGVNEAAAAARAAGFEIYVKLYYSTDQSKCPAGNANNNYCVRQWLLDDIVSGEQAFFDTDPNEPYTDFPCEFVQLVHVINCDDGNPCTFDRCVNGHCTHEPIPGCP